MPTTGLQQACNMPATSAGLQPCYSAAPVPLGGRDGVPAAARPGSCAVAVPPRVGGAAREALVAPLWLVAVAALSATGQFEVEARETS